MQIIIVGAGQVGGSLAEQLTTEQHEITLIDCHEDNVKELQDRLDLRTVIGMGSHPTVLAEAGAKSADMLIAVTDNDEVNMVACQVAYSLFNTPTKIARIRSQNYFADNELFGSDHLPIDFFISPEQVVTQYIHHLIEYPGALQVLNFAEGRVKLVVTKPFYGGLLLGKNIDEITLQLSQVDAKIVAVFRANELMPLTNETEIEIGDEVYFVAASEQIPTIMAALRRIEEVPTRIMIVGGGNIGSLLAARLSKDYQVKLIEHNRERCELLAEQLPNTTVLCGSGCDKTLLTNENIEHIDVFCALTNDDEDNIIACLQAKQLGAKQVMALITRPAYVDLIEGGTININIAISPQQATVSSILSHLRRGDTVAAHALRRGTAEAIELIAHGDKTTSKVVGRRVKEISMPAETIIAAVVRDSEIFMAHPDTLINQEDHLILFIGNKKRVKQVEKLFQVSAGFF